MKYLIVTPAYASYTGTFAPPEYGSDVVEVEAPNKKKAKVLGLQKLRRIRSQWIQDMTSDNRNPFNGLEVHEA